MFFFPGVLLLHWQCDWDHCHAENETVVNQIFSGWHFLFSWFNLKTSPTPLDEMHPETMTQAPPCFTQGCTHLLLCLSDLLHRYRCWFDQKRQMWINYSIRPTDTDTSAFSPPFPLLRMLLDRHPQLRPLVFAEFLFLVLKKFTFR